MTRISFPSIITSGSILTVCGYTVFFISTSPAIREVGHLVGRGAVFSVFFVTTLMPAVLQIIDRFIVTTMKERHRQRRELLEKGIRKERELLSEGITAVRETIMEKTEADPGGEKAETGGSLKEEADTVSKQQKQAAGDEQQKGGQL